MYNVRGIMYDISYKVQGLICNMYVVRFSFKVYIKV